MMDYREHAPPVELAGLVKVAWTLETGGNHGQSLSHVATPDGCVEIIRRIAGQSEWGCPQPTEFVAGLITEPAELRLSGDSRFVALRIWPWAWNRLAPSYPTRSFINHWHDLRMAMPDLALPDQAEDLFGLVPHNLLDAEDANFARAILACTSVAGLAAATGRSHRSIQRWFAREIGLPPRTYLRLTRFNETFSGLPTAAGTLADHAAAHGFADQAHMAREFRRMSGQPAVRARDRVQGPFLRGDV